MRNPYLNLLAIAWHYARDKKRRYLLTYGIFCVTNVIAALRPLLYGWFINAIQQHGTQVLQYTWKYVLLYLASILLAWSIQGPARIIERSLAFDLSRNFLLSTYRQVLRFPLNWHKDNHSGAAANRIRKAYEALKEFFENGFNYFQTFGKFAASLVAMIYFSPLFGTAGILLGALTVWFILKFDKPIITNLDETNEKEHLVSASLSDGLSNFNTVFALRLQQQMEKSLDEKVSHVFPPFVKYIKFNEWKWFTADVMVAVIYCVVTLGYVLQHYQAGSVFYIGGLVTLIMYVNQFTSVFHDIAWQYNQIIQYHTQIISVEKLKKAYNSNEITAAQEPLTQFKTIEVRNLNFYYSSEKKTSLHQLNFRVDKGKRIAVIGESGSGKSTLLSLIRGLQQPAPGLSVTVDGKDCQNLELIGEMTTLIPQDPEIFENTVRFNITLGLNFDDESITEACRIAHFTPVLALLPDGLDTSIKEKGVNLSGGQKQRLALARGILAAQNSALLLLDEPTSSVDPRTEALIYRGIFEEFSNKTVISTLYRSSLLPYFDYIYILQQGKIVGEGTFAHLEANSAVFREILHHRQNNSAQ